MFRVEGADVYGSFLIGITLSDSEGRAILEMDGKELAAFPEANIHNVYVTKVKPGKHSLILPLGGKAELTIRAEALHNLPTGDYQLTLTDISGLTWTETVAF